MSPNAGTAILLPPGSRICWPVSLPLSEPRDALAALFSQLLFFHLWSALHPLSLAFPSTTTSIFKAKALLLDSELEKGKRYAPLFQILNLILLAHFRLSLSAVRWTGMEITPGQEHNAQALPPALPFLARRLAQVSLPGESVFSSGK